MGGTTIVNPEQSEGYGPAEDRNFKTAYWGIKKCYSENIDDDTPSFAISLYKEYRGHGIGTRLMLRMLELLRNKGFRKASLAVQKANYAVRMYEKVGFKVVSENNEEYIMVNTAQLFSIIQ